MNGRSAIDVQLHVSALGKNDKIAAENRELCERAGVHMINVLGSPGAGKTTLLELVLGELAREFAVGVIEGDLATTRDAERIAGTGVPVIQLNTDGLCHLDARMVQRALKSLPLGSLDFVIVENVGNLVCPADFSLGEHRRLGVLSTTEGGDKIVKYAKLFRILDALVVSKTDLLPFTDFDVQAAAEDFARLCPSGEVFPVSARKGEGIDAVVKWISAPALV